MPTLRKPGLRFADAPWLDALPRQHCPSQLSLAINLLLVGVIVPIGVNSVMQAKYHEKAQARTASDVAQLLSDHEHAVLEALNVSRSSKGLPALARLPSELAAAELDSAVSTDRAVQAGEETLLVHGIHADAETEWEKNLFRRCELLHRQAVAEAGDVHQGRTHRTSGTEYVPDEVLAEAKKQGLDI